MARVPDRQVPGVYHRRVGDIVVTAVSDGYLDATLAILRNIADGEAERLLAEAFRPTPPRLAVNAFVVHAKGRTALIETGSGTSMGPTLGRLPENLRAAGTEPGEIDTVLLTHMHPDHSNGLTDDSGRAWFPRSELLIHEADVAHWKDDGRMAQASERQRVRYFEAARRQLVPYEREQLRTITEGEVFPGVTAIPIPGHTPGHTAYLIADGGDSVLVWGDTVHIPDIQVPRPDVTLEFDTDPTAAAAMRRRLFDMAATDRLLVAGMHLHFPGFAHMVRHGDGYALVPEPWSSAF